MRAAQRRFIERANAIQQPTFIRIRIGTMVVRPHGMSYSTRTILAAKNEQGGRVRFYSFGFLPMTAPAFKVAPTVGYGVQVEDSDGCLTYQNEGTDGVAIQMDYFRKAGLMVTE
jgi:hypothetical protein